MGGTSCDRFSLSSKIRAFARFGYTADCHGLGRVPIVFDCDVNESPFGDLCSMRDRVGEMSGFQNLRALLDIILEARVFSTLACSTSAYEGIYDGVALAQVTHFSISVRFPRANFRKRKPAIVAF